VIGLLIVSHSPKIAEGVRDLAAQMTQGKVPLAAAGGTAEGDLGTSADLIRAGAADLVAAGATGVLVLADLGSAVMSAEIAFEDFGGPYRLADAPLVEGALMAAVEASIGSDLAKVAAAAEGAREIQKVLGD
jgi:dihydroxyacetone kinase phosphotransfer subunit